MPPIHTVHLVGSSGQENTKTSFHKCSTSLPGLLKRIPDGETGERFYFVHWQAAFFASVLEISPYQQEPDKTYSPDEVSAAIAKLKAANPRTGYEDAAIASYATFKRLRDDEGAIDQGVKFKSASRPSQAWWRSTCTQPSNSAVQPVYEAALLSALSTIQSKIPHEDLSIQLDLAFDTAFWEDFPANDTKFPAAWFHPGPGKLEERRQYMIEYTIRLFDHVAEDVELGIHNCYGDMAHAHFMEPSSLAAVSDRGLALLTKSNHPINYFHLPVPVSAMGSLEEFYEPLRRLVPSFKEQGTELYLGVVQAGDPEGTRNRMDAAKKVLGGFAFGVATECGWGRTPKEDLESIFEILREASEPIA